MDHCNCSYNSKVKNESKIEKMEMYAQHDDVLNFFHC